LVEKLNKVSRNREERGRGAAPASAEAVSADEMLAGSSPANRLAGAQSGVGDEVLGNMRAGLQVRPDYEIAIGVTRSVSLNGVEQFMSTVQLDGLTGGAGGPRADASALRTILFQNGVGNLLARSGVPAAIDNDATIIQNTLDNQRIATKTIVDISLQNVSSAIRAINAGQLATQSLNAPH
jgi:hypothetical protein